MESCEWRFLLSPSERPALLSFGQALCVFQAAGLTSETPTGEISVRAVGEYVVFMSGPVPMIVKSREEWRKMLDGWRPMPIVPEKF